MINIAAEFNYPYSRKREAKRRRREIRKREGRKAGRKEERKEGWGKKKRGTQEGDREKKFFQG